MNRIVLSILFCFLFSVYCSAFELTDPNKPIMISKSHPNFDICMESNPTTGFIWMIREINDTCIIPQKHSYYMNKEGKNMSGSGGYDIWSFSMRKRCVGIPRIFSIAFEYTRPFEMTGKMAKVFKVIVSS